MAVTANGGFGQTELKKSDGTDLVVDLINDTIKCALFTNAITPNFDTDVGYGSAPYNANEVSGTGYTAAGVVLGTKTYTLISGRAHFDSADPSWTGATLSGVRAALVYDDSLASDRGLLLANLGADFAVDAGTLTILLSVSGWWYLDYTP